MSPNPFLIVIMILIYTTNTHSLPLLATNTQCSKNSLGLPNKSNNKLSCENRSGFHSIVAAVARYWPTCLTIFSLQLLIKMLSVNYGSPWNQFLYSHSGFVGWSRQSFPLTDNWMNNWHRMTQLPIIVNFSILYTNSNVTLLITHVHTKYFKQKFCIHNLTSLVNERSATSSTDLNGNQHIKHEVHLHLKHLRRVILWTCAS